MFAAFIGILGVVLGTGVTYILDLKKATMRDVREDQTWRRQHVLDAASELLAATELVRVNAMTVHDIRAKLVEAEAAGNIAMVNYCRDGLPTYESAMKNASVSGTAALSRLSILVPQSVILAGNELIMGTLQSPKDSANTTRMIQLLDLVRAEIGIPARELAEHTAKR